MLRRRRHLNTAPGELIASAGSGEPVHLSIYDYHSESCRQVEADEIADAVEHLERAVPEQVRWLNCDGIPGKADLQRLGESLGIHPLVLEDIQNTDQRAKIEDHGGYLFIMFPMMWRESEELRFEQVAVLLFPNLVVSVQERPGDVFNGLRRRIESGSGRIRRMGADYLAHAVLDAVVDNLFPVFEQIDADIQEQETLTLSGSDNMDEVHRLRRELALVRRKLRPLRELLSQLATIESDLLTEDVRPFLRDLRDHGLQVLDDLELVGDHLRVLIDLQLNQLNQQTNSIVKTLTIVASIFIPLTFLAGLYGMNFEHLPGANSPFGFAVICVIMALVAGGLLLYFKKKKWI